MSSTASANPANLLAQVVANNLAFWQQRLQGMAAAEYPQLAAEQANLLRAVWFGLRLPATHAATNQLLVPLMFLIDHWGTWHTWLPVVEALLPQVTDPLERAHLLEMAGLAHRRLHKLAEAATYYEAAVALLRDVNNWYEVARLQQGLCDVYRLQHEYAAAEKAGQLALEIFTELGKAQSPQMAATRGVLGQVASAQGHWAVADDHFVAAATLWRALGEKLRLARTLNNYAIVLHSQQRFAEAKVLYAEALEVVKATDNAMERVNILTSLGAVLFEQGELAAAEECFRQADSDWLRQSPYLALRGTVANNLGNVCAAQGRLTEAEAHLRGAVQLCQQAQDGLNLANALCTLGETLARQGQKPEAQACYAQALALLAQYPTNAFARRLQTKYAAQAQVLNET